MEAAPHTHQQRVDHAGVQLTVYRWRPTESADKLLLISHGLGEHARRYGHVAAYFNERGYEVVGFDHEGHGASGGARGRITSRSSLVGETAAVLNAVDAPQYRHRILWAHSMGGLLALAALREDGFAERLSAAVVTSPSLRVGNPPDAVTKAAAGVLANLAPDGAIPNGLNANDLSHDPGIVADYLADPLNHDRLSFRLGQVFLKLPDVVLAVDAAPGTPLLLMQGGADAICLPEGAHAYLRANPDAPIVYREWPGLKHELHNEPKWRDVLAAAAEFLHARLR